MSLFDEIRQAAPWAKDLSDRDIVLKGAEITGMQPFEVAKELGVDTSKRGLFGAANDYAIELANAAANLPKAALDFVSPGTKASAAIGEFQKEGEARQTLSAQEAKYKLGQSMQSEDLGEQAKGALTYIKENPLLSASQAIGSFVGPGAAIKGSQLVSGALNLGSKATGRVALGSAAGTTGVMAGGDAAGDAYDMVMNSPNLQNMSIEERHSLATDAARKASAVPFVLGAGTSFLPGAEKALSVGTKSILRTGAGEFAGEFVEEGATKLSANLAAQQYAPEVRAMQGVVGSAVLGGVLGGGTGLAVGAMNKQPGSLLQGTAQTEIREGNPNANAINNAIDSNSTEISTNSGQQVIQIQQQQAQLQQAQADAKAQADAVAAQQAQQQAAQKTQEAQQAFIDVASTYGFTPNPTGTLSLGKILIRTPEIAQQYITQFEIANKDKSPTQKALFGAALSSGAVPVKPGVTPKAIATSVNTFLNNWQLAGIEDKAEAAEWVNTIIPTIEGANALKEAAPLNEFYKSLTGQDAPAFASLLEQATEKPTKTKGVKDEQLQQLQTNAGLRAVSEQGGTTQVSGNQPGDVRPSGVQPIQPGSLGEGSLSLQTGAVSSGGVPTSTNATPSGANNPLAQGQVNANQPKVTTKKRRGGVPEQAVEGSTAVEQTVEDKATGIVETVVRNVIDAVVKRRGRMSNVNLQKLKDFIYYDFSQIENKEAKTGELTKKELADMFGVSTDTIDGWQDIANNFFEENRGVIQAQLYQTLDASGMSLLDLKEQIQASRDFAVGEAVSLEEEERRSEQVTEVNREDEEDFEQNAVEDAEAADLGLTQVEDESQLDQRDLQGEKTGMGVYTGRTGVSVQEENKPEETINARYIRKAKELDAAENSGDEELTAKLSKELDALVDEAAGVAKKQVSKSEAIAGEKKKGTKNAVQKRSTEGVSVRKQAEVSERIPSKDTEGNKAPAKNEQAVKEVSSLTVEEQASKAWNDAAKEFPDAPKFAELTEEQRADWVSFGEENWTPEDVQTELVKLAKESATGKAQFSRNEGAGKNETWDADGLTSLLKQMFVANKNFDNLVGVVANYDELPTYVKNAVKKSAAIQAFVYGKRVYMLADQIQVGQELPVFLHEVGVHLGMENLLGTANYRKLAGQVMTWANAKNDSQETIIARAAKERVDAARADAIANGEALTANELLDEMLAYFVEEAVALGVNPTAVGKDTSQIAQWFRSLMAALKIALRKVGFDKFDKLSAGNIVDLAFGAAKMEISGAYHGTAAEFRDFKTAHIGTGEGAVAFGWGIYVAERFGIAFDYMTSDVKRKQMSRKGEPDITYKGIGYKDLSGMQTDLFIADRLEYDRRNIASTMIRDLHYDYNNTLTVDSLIVKKIKTYEAGLETAESTLAKQNNKVFKPSEKEIKEAQNSKDYYERSLAAIKTIDPNDFDFPSKAGFTYKGRTKKALRRAEMENLGKDIENKVALDVVRQYETLKEDFGVPAPVEDIIKLQIEALEKSIADNEIGALSGTTQKTIDALKALNPKDFKDSTKKAGNLMRVLPMADEGSLMDLDTRLAAQPEVLQKIKEGFPEDVRNAIEEKANIELEDLSGRDLQRVMVDLENRGVTELYFEMPESITDSIKQGRFMSEEIVSKYLEYKLGIEGVKYFDASSRSIGGQISVAKLPELEKIKFEVKGRKFYPKYASIRSNDVIIKGRIAGQTSDTQLRLKDFAPEADTAAIIDHIKDEQARQTKNVVMFKDKGVSRVATFPGAKLDSKVKFSLKKARETTAKQIDKLPKPIRTPLQSMMDNIYDFAKKGLPFFSFTEDLADMAAKYVPSAKKYVNLMKERQAIRTKFERNVDQILQKYDSLPTEVKGTGENSVNRFLKDTTMSGKWAYNPGWIKKFDEEKDIDPALKARFDAMPAKAQSLIKEVFTHGQSTLLAMQKAVNENINTEYDALIAAANAVNDTKEAADLTKKKASTLTEYNTLMRTNSTKPYAPLKRFGNYVVVGKSQLYIENEIMASSKTAAPDKIAEARKKLRELEKNEDHYFVQFAETAGEANAIVRDEAGNYDYLENFEKDSSQGFGVRDLNDVFNRLRNMVEEGTDSNLSETSQKVLNRLMADLKLTLLSESSARQSERRRKNVAGAEDDMMRAFATQGRATASFIASMENSGDIYDTLRDMKKEADGYDGAGTRAERRRYYNEFMKRHFMGMDYQPSPFVDKALSTTSMWMLLTNPAYYLQNMTQPFMMSLPVIAGTHGYNRSWKEMTRAYTDIASVIRKYGVSEESYSKLPEDVRQVVETLVNRGRIDISLEQDLGRWRSSEDSKLAKFGQASELLRSMAQDIETINRVATAVAAYRLEVKRSNPTNATNYADKIIYTTHGDYSGFNAPRISRSTLGRLATQFRKFQLIQISLMARLFNDAFKGQDAETRMIGKRALTFTIGHTAVMGGLLGLPGFAAISALYGMLFGDEDEPDNPELALRRAIGDEAIADLLLKGVPAALGVDLSGKLGMGQMLSVMPYTDITLSRKGVYEAVGTLITGPFGGLLAKSAEGMGYIGRGDYYKGIEQLVPTGLSNAMKGYRYGTEGITSKTGDITMSPDDISAIDSFMVALGLPTKTITDRQFLQSAKFEYDQFYNEKTSELKRKYVRAYSEGDTAARGEVMEDWRKLQESRVRNGYTKQPLSTLLKAPQEKAKRERNTVGGVAVNKANRGFVRQTSEL
jgi:hypothetical protein